MVLNYPVGKPQSATPWSTFKLINQDHLSNIALDVPSRHPALVKAVVTLVTLKSSVDAEAHSQHSMAEPDIYGFLF